MKKGMLTTLLFLCLCFGASANPNDSIATVYKNGEFYTVYRLYVNASDSVSSRVLSNFDQQMCYNLDGLFSWALKKMNLRKEKTEMMMFYFKTTAFNKQTSVLRATGDVIIPGITTIDNIVVDSKLSSKKLKNGTSAVYLDLISANGFIKKMNSSFSTIPRKDNGYWYVLESRVKFGWFFDIFITQNRFKSIMEWRLKQFVRNLRDEAERRERLLTQEVKNTSK